MILGYQGGGKAVGEIKSNGFPLGQTQFTDVYATDGSKLTFDKDAIEPGTASWVNGSRRQAYSYQAGVNTGGEVSSPTGPDEVELSTFPFDAADRDRRPDHGEPVRVLDARRTPSCSCSCSTARPDGTLLYLNRGMLRASHRQIDEAESQKTADGRIYRPVATARRSASLVTPGRGHRLPDRHLPGRPRVPARARAGREGARAAARRQRLQLHPEDAARARTRCTSGRTRRRG